MLNKQETIMLFKTLGIAVTIVIDLKIKFMTYKALKKYNAK